MSSVKVNIKYDKSIEEALSEVCTALVTNEEGINKILKIELHRLQVLTKNIEHGNVNIEEDIVLIREVRKLVDSLIMYQWVSEKKIDSIKELVVDITN